MEQQIQIKAKYSKDDNLFALKEEEKLVCLIPVRVSSVSNIKILGQDMHVITYSVIALKSGYSGPSLEVKETDLYQLEELNRFMK